MSSGIPTGNALTQAFQDAFLKQMEAKGLPDKADTPYREAVQAAINEIRAKYPGIDLTAEGQEAFEQKIDAAWKGAKTAFVGSIAGKIVALAPVLNTYDNKTSGDFKKYIENNSTLKGAKFTPSEIRRIFQFSRADLRILRAGGPKAEALWRKMMPAPSEKSEIEENLETEFLSLIQKEGGTADKEKALKKATERLSRNFNVILSPREIDRAWKNAMGEFEKTADAKALLIQTALREYDIVHEPKGVPFEGKMEELLKGAGLNAEEIERFLGLPRSALDTIREGATTAKVWQPGKVWRETPPLPSLDTEIKTLQKELELSPEIVANDILKQMSTAQQAMYNKLAKEQKLPEGDERRLKLLQNILGKVVFSEKLVGLRAVQQGVTKLKTSLTTGATNVSIAQGVILSPPEAMQFGGEPRTLSALIKSFGAERVHEMLRAADATIPAIVKAAAAPPPGPTIAVMGNPKVIAITQALQAYNPNLTSKLEEPSIALSFKETIEAHLKESGLSATDQSQVLARLSSLPTAALEIMWRGGPPAAALWTEFETALAAKDANPAALAQFLTKYASPFGPEPAKTIPYGAGKSVPYTGAEAIIRSGSIEAEDLWEAFRIDFVLPELSETIIPAQLTAITAKLKKLKFPDDQIPSFEKAYREAWQRVCKEKPTESISQRLAALPAMLAKVCQTDPYQTLNNYRLNSQYSWFFNDISSADICKDGMDGAVAVLNEQVLKPQPELAAARQLLRRGDAEAVIRDGGPEAEQLWNALSSEFNLSDLGDTLLSARMNAAGPEFKTAGLSAEEVDQVWDAYKKAWNDVCTKPPTASQTVQQKLATFPTALDVYKLSFPDGKTPPGNKWDSCKSHVASAATINAAKDAVVQTWIEHVVPPAKQVSGDMNRFKKELGLKNEEIVSEVRRHLSPAQNRKLEAFARQQGTSQVTIEDLQNFLGSARLSDALRDMRKLSDSMHKFKESYAAMSKTPGLLAKEKIAPPEKEMLLSAMSQLSAADFAALEEGYQLEKTDEPLSMKMLQRYLGSERLAKILANPPMGEARKAAAVGNFLKIYNETRPEARRPFMDMATTYLKNSGFTESEIAKFFTFSQKDLDIFRKNDSTAATKTWTDWKPAFKDTAAAQVVQSTKRLEDLRFKKEDIAETVYNKLLPREQNLLNAAAEKENKFPMSMPLLQRVLGPGRLAQLLDLVEKEQPTYLASQQHSIQEQLDAALSKQGVLRRKKADAEVGVAILEQREEARNSKAEATLVEKRQETSLSASTADVTKLKGELTAKPEELIKSITNKVGLTSATGTLITQLRTVDIVEVAKGITKTNLTTTDNPTPSDFEVNKEMKKTDPRSIVGFHLETLGVSRKTAIDLLDATTLVRNASTVKTLADQLCTTDIATVAKAITKATLTRPGEPVPSDHDVAQAMGKTPHREIVGSHLHALGVPMPVARNLLDKTALVYNAKNVENLITRLCTTNITAVAREITTASLTTTTNPKPTPEQVTEEMAKTTPDNIVGNHLTALGVPKQTAGELIKATASAYNASKVHDLVGQLCADDILTVAKEITKESLITSANPSPSQEQVIKAMGTKAPRDIVGPKLIALGVPTDTAKELLTATTSVHDASRQLIEIEKRDIAEIQGQLTALGVSEPIKQTILKTGDVTASGLVPETTRSLKAKKAALGQLNKKKADAENSKKDSKILIEQTIAKEPLSATNKPTVESLVTSLCSANIDTVAQQIVKKRLSTTLGHSPSESEIGIAISKQNGSRAIVETKLGELGVSTESVEILLQNTNSMRVATEQLAEITKQIAKLSTATGATPKVATEGAAIARRMTDLGVTEDAILLGFEDLLDETQKEQFNAMSQIETGNITQVVQNLSVILGGDKVRKRLEKLEHHAINFNKAWSEVFADEKTTISTVIKQLSDAEQRRIGMPIPTTVAELQKHVPLAELAERLVDYNKLKTDVITERQKALSLGYTEDELIQIICKENAFDIKKAKPTTFRGLVSILKKDVVIATLKDIQTKATAAVAPAVARLANRVFVADDLNKEVESKLSTKERQDFEVRNAASPPAAKISVEDFLSKAEFNKRLAEIKRQFVAKEVERQLSPREQREFEQLNAGKAAASKVSIAKFLGEGEFVKRLAKMEAQFAAIEKTKGELLKLPDLDTPLKINTAIEEILSAGERATMAPIGGYLPATGPVTLTPFAKGLGLIELQKKLDALKAKA